MEIYSGRPLRVTCACRGHYLLGSGIGGGWGAVLEKAPITVDQNVAWGAQKRSKGGWIFTRNLASYLSWSYFCLIQKCLSLESDHPLIQLGRDPSKHYFFCLSVLHTIHYDNFLKVDCN